MFSWLTSLSSRVFAEIITVPERMPYHQSILWYGIIPGLIKLLLFLAFILAVIFLLWGGISWIASGGNKEALEGARKKVTYAILGLILVLLSFAILYTFGGLFRLNLRNP